MGAEVTEAETETDRKTKAVVKDGALGGTGS